MRPTLALIRHCRSDADPQLPPATWGLTEVGHAQARALVSRFERDEVVAIACGPEPKMTQSVAPLAQARDLVVDSHGAYAESHSEGWLSAGRFDEAVAAFFRDPTIAPAPGWESADDAATRFLSAVGDLLARHDGGTIAVCSGGRVLSAALAQLGLIPPTQVLAGWRRIQMPDVALIGFDADQDPVLLRPFGDASR